MSAFFRFVSATSARRHLLAGIMFLGLCGVFMGTTNPTRTSLILLLIPFVLFALSLYCLGYAILSKVFGVHSIRLRRLIAGVVSAVSVVVLLLRSLNQLTFRDGLILLVLVGLFGLYLRRADFLN